MRLLADPEMPDGRRRVGKLIQEGGWRAELALIKNGSRGEICGRGLVLEHSKEPL